jgi:hypothetical protein
MFLIFGLRTKARQLGWVAMPCRVCGQTGTLMVVRETTKLSLFFIPLVPVRTKHAVQCANPVCGNRFTVSAGEARRLLAAGVGSAR